MNKEIFVQNVKKYCELAGVKPTVACRESGVGSSFINNIESRNQTPSVAKVQMLAQYLGVTTSELLGEEIPNLDELEKMFRLYDVRVTPRSGTSPEDQEEICKFASRFSGLNFNEQLSEIDPDSQWEVLRLGREGLETKARREAAEKKPIPAAGDGLSPLDQRLNELLAAADDKTKQAMVAFLEQFQKP